VSYAKACFELTFEEKGISPSEKRAFLGGTETLGKFPSSPNDPFNPPHDFPLYLPDQSVPKDDQNHPSQGELRSAGRIFLLPVSREEVFDVTDRGSSVFFSHDDVTRLAFALFACLHSLTWKTSFPSLVRGHEMCLWRDLGLFLLPSGRGRWKKGPN